MLALESDEINRIRKRIYTIFIDYRLLISGSGTGHALAHSGKGLGEDDASYPTASICSRSKPRSPKNLFKVCCASAKRR